MYQRTDAESDRRGLCSNSKKGKQGSINQLARNVIQTDDEEWGKGGLIQGWDSVSLVPKIRSFVTASPCWETIFLIIFIHKREGGGGIGFWIPLRLALHKSLITYSLEETKVVLAPLTTLPLRIRYELTPPSSESWEPLPLLKLSSSRVKKKFLGPLHRHSVD